MQKIIDVLNGIIALLIPQFRNPNSTAGVKELKEAVLGINELALYLSAKMTDGVQFKDFTDLYNHIQNDSQFKVILENAWDKKELIPAEVKDIDAGEALEVVQVQLPYVQKFIEVFQNKEEA